MIGCGAIKFLRFDVNKKSCSCIYPHNEMYIILDLLQKLLHCISKVIKTRKLSYKLNR